MRVLPLFLFLVVGMPVFIFAQAVIPSLWLASDAYLQADSSNGVYEWKNISDTSVFAIQEDEEFMPLLVYDSIVDKQVISFASSYLSLGDTLDFKNVRSGFFVLREEYSSGEKFFFSKGKNSDGAFGFSHRYNNYKLFVSGQEFKLNSIAKTWAIVSFFVHQADSSITFCRNQDSLRVFLGDLIFGDNELSLIIGRSPETTPSYFKGALAEVMIFQDELSFAQVDSLYSYFSEKYAPPVDLPENRVVGHLCDTAIVNAAKPWFVSYQWSVGSTHSQIVIDSSGCYAVTVTDVFGNVSSDSLCVYFPKIDVCCDTVICEGDFVELSALPNYKYRWNTGDMSQFVTVGQGVYFCVLTDSIGCFLQTDSIVVEEKMRETNEIADTVYLCQNQLFDLSYFYVDSVTWANVDSLGSSIFNNSRWNGFFVHEKGCSFYDSLYIDIGGVPPSIEFEIEGECVNNDIVFTNKTFSIDSSIMSYWIIGHDTVEDAVFAKRFPEGLYGATIVASNQRCSVDSFFVFNVKPMLSVELSLQDEIACVDSSVLLYPINSCSVNCQWFCNDVFLFQGDSLLFNFENAGLHQFMMIAVSDSACADTVYAAVNAVPSSKTSVLEIISPVDASMYVKNEIECLWDSVGIAHSEVTVIHADSIFVQHSCSSEGNFNIANLPNGYFSYYHNAETVCGQKLVSDTVCFSVNSPCNNQGLSFWIHARMGIIDSSVSSLASLCGDIVALQSDSAHMPLVFKSDIEYLYFDNSFLSLGDTFDLKDISAMYMLVRETYSAKHKILLSKGKKDAKGFAIYNNYSKYNLSANGDVYPLVDGVEDGAWALLSFRVDKDKNRAEFCRNGKCCDFDFFADSSCNTLPLYVGNDPLGASGPLIGGVAELMIFTDTVSDESAYLIDDYFKKNYSKPFSFSADTVIVSNLCDTAVLRVGAEYSFVRWSTGDIGDSVIVQTSGWYCVSVSDYLGFEYVDSVYVKCRQPIVFSDTVLCANDSVLWMPLDAGNYRFEWSNGSLSDSVWVSAGVSFWFAAIDSLGCVLLSDTVRVDLHDLYDCDFFGADTLRLCRGDVVEPDTSRFYYGFEWRDSVEIMIAQSSGWYNYYCWGGNCLREDSVFVEIADTEHYVAPLILYPTHGNVLSDNQLAVSWKHSGALFYRVSCGNTVITTLSDKCEFVINENGIMPIVVAAVYNCGYIVHSDTVFVDVQSVASEYGIALWLCSDSLVSIDSNGVFSWKSVVGGCVAMQERADFYPNIEIDNLLNNRQVLSFETGFVSLGDTFDLKDFSALFVVMKETRSSSDKLYVSKGKNDLYGFAFSTRYDKHKLYVNKQSFDLAEGIGNGGWSFCSFRQNRETGVSVFYRNGMFDTIPIVGNGSDNAVPFYIGDDPLGASGPFVGSIAEIIIGSNLMSDYQFHLVQDYLQQKYSRAVTFEEKRIEIADVCDGVLLSAYQPWFAKYQWSTGEVADTVFVQNSGWYSVTATDCFGSVSSDSVYVDIRKWEPLLLRDTVICYGDTLKYQWNSARDSIVWSQMPPLFFNTSEVSYRRIGENGCVYYSDTVKVYVDTTVKNLSLGSDTVLCRNNTVGIRNLSIENVSILWNTNGTLPYVYADTTGLFSVEVVSANNCYFADSIYVSVEGEITASDIVVRGKCQGDTVLFSSKNENTLDISYWIINGDTLPYSQLSFEAFSADSMYVSLIHENDFGCISRSDTVVVIYPKPEVSFQLPVLCVGDSAFFKNTSILESGEFGTVCWVMGRDTSFERDYSFLVSEQAAQSVLLMVESAVGCADSIEIPLVVHPSPLAGFTLKSMCYGDSLVVDRVHSLPGERSFWVFDGDTVVDDTLKVLLDRDEFSFMLIVENEFGCASRKDTLFSVGYKPFALFFVDSLYCQYDTIVPVNMSDIEDGFISEYRWVFKDDIYYDSRPVFQARDTGFFDLQLQVASGSFCIDTFLQSFFVAPKPQAYFELPPDSDGLPLFLQIENMSNNYTVSRWVINDSIAFLSENLFAEIKMDGQYALQLQVFWDSLCFDTLTRHFIVAGDSVAVNIVDVVFRLDDHFVTTSISVVNEGNTIIESLIFRQRAINSGTIQQQWNGLLFPADTLLFQFASSINVLDETTPICLSVATAEDNCTFADTCFSNQSSFRVLSLLPNPISDAFTVEIACPKSSLVVVSIIDVDGVIVESFRFENTDSGFLRVPVNFQNETSGNYFLKVECNGEVLIRPLLFVK